MTPEFRRLMKVVSTKEQERILNDFKDFFSSSQLSEIEKIKAK